MCGCPQLRCAICDSVCWGEWHIGKCSVCLARWRFRFQAEGMTPITFSCDQYGRFHCNPRSHRHIGQVTFNNDSLPWEGSKHSMRLGEVINKPAITALAPERLWVLGWNCHGLITQSDASCCSEDESKKEKAESHLQADEQEIRVFQQCIQNFWTTLDYNSSLCLYCSIKITHTWDGRIQSLYKQ